MPDKMKRIALFLLLLTFSTLIFGQLVNRDVIYLKNESILKGIIIEKTGDIVKIEIEGGSIIALEVNRIEKIEKEKYSDATGIKEKGYLNLTSLGLLIGSSKNPDKSPFSLLSEHNYRFNKYFAAGGVIGVEILNEATVPMGLNLKGIMPLSGGGIIYLGTTLGYSVSLEKPVMENYIVKEAAGGQLFNAEIGLVLPSKNNAGFLLAIGYRYNTLNYVREDWRQQEVERKIYFNRLSIRLGICFY